MPNERPPVWFVVLVHAVMLALLLSLPACVRTTTVCVEASHSRPSPDWTRNDSVGASVCAEIGPRE